jgi:hypothetical protein
MFTYFLCFYTKKLFLRFVYTAIFPTEKFLLLISFNILRKLPTSVVLLNSIQYHLTCVECHQTCFSLSRSKRYDNDFLEIINGCRVFSLHFSSHLIIYSTELRDNSAQKWMLNKFAVAIIAKYQLIMHKNFHPRWGLQYFFQ